MQNHNKNLRTYFANKILKNNLQTMTREKNILEEGLIVSYDSKQLISKISQTYSNDVKYIEDCPLFPTNPSKYGKANSIFITFKTKPNTDALNKILSLYGYFITYEESVGEEYDVTIEPKYPVRYGEFPPSINFYHITPTINLEKIKKIGITPRTSKTLFKHEGNRIYILISKTIRPVEKFKMVLSDHKNIAEMSILELFDISQDVFVDESFDHVKGKCYAGFVLKNIHPNKIKNTL